MIALATLRLLAGSAAGGYLLAELTLAAETVLRRRSSPVLTEPGPAKPIDAAEALARAVSRWTQLPRVAAASEGPDGVEVVVDPPPPGSTAAAIRVVAPTIPEVRVLGPVEIVGARERIHSHKAVEIVAYLAFHRRGARSERLRTALSPEAAMRRHAFDGAVWKARRLLGVGPTGERLLPRAGDGYFRLDPTVATDVERLVAAVGILADGEACIALHDALGVVRGLPFDEPDGYEWAQAEGIASYAQLTTARAAHRLAQLALEVGDADEAEWATRQGLLAAPYDQQLFRDRIEAAHRRHGGAGVRTIVAELCAALEEGDPALALEPETLALVEELAPQSLRRP